MARLNISRTVQSYLTVLAEQARHYAALRLFGGMETALQGRLCLDAQVPLFSSSENELLSCSLVALVSYREEGQYRQLLLQLESHYDPQEVLALGPVRWQQLADTLAYQLISQLVQWKKERDVSGFALLSATTGLKPDRQRFYL